MDITITVAVQPRKIIERGKFLLPVRIGQQKFGLTWQTGKGWLRDDARERLTQCMRRNGMPIKAINHYLQLKARKKIK
jgi:hypothetical protein